MIYFNKKEIPARHDSDVTVT